MIKFSKPIHFCYYCFDTYYLVRCFPGGSEVKASACNAEDLGSIPGSGRSPGEGNGNPLQYSCLENPMGGGAWWATGAWEIMKNRGAWRAAVHGVAKSRTGLSDFTFTWWDRQDTPSTRSVLNTCLLNEAVNQYSFCLRGSKRLRDWIMIIVIFSSVV